MLRFELKAGPTGALFGSVTPSDIADEIWRTRKIRIDRRKIELPNPIKRIGNYAVPVHIFEEVNVELKTLVVPEGGELTPEQELAMTSGEPVDEPAVEAASKEPEALVAEATPVEDEPAEDEPAEDEPTESAS